MPKAPARTCFPFQWPKGEPAPAGPAKGGIGDLVAALRAGPDGVPDPEGGLDPLVILRPRAVPARLALWLLDQQVQRYQPTSWEVLDRLTDAYLLTALRACRRFPPVVGRRRLVATAALRALRLSDRLFRDRWRAQTAPPADWWRRYLETFRSLGTAHLLAVRCPPLEGGAALTPHRAAAELLLRAVANPFAWESELIPHLERILAMLAEEVLLFPAASPTAYAEGRPGRFLFDARGDMPPVPPEVFPEVRPDSPSPHWWIVDTGRALTRIGELQRSLALGVPPARVHPLLAEIPSAPRRILLARLEKVLARRHRRNRFRPEVAAQAHLAVGLEQAVRHCFAHRWSGSRDPGSLHANVRLQSEMGTRAGAAAGALSSCEVVERSRGGMRLQSRESSFPVLTGKVVTLLEEEGHGEDRAEPRIAIARWQQRDPGDGLVQMGLEILNREPQDCWCRVVSGMAASLQEHPGILLDTPEGNPFLLVPPGLFRTGALLTARVDDRDYPLQLLHLQEEGVHFELIEVRPSAKE